MQGDQGQLEIVVIVELLAIVHAVGIKIMLKNLFKQALIGLQEYLR